MLDDADGYDSPMREGGFNNAEDPTVHDGEFYIDGADCVIRVDDTLFKVMQIIPIACSTLRLRHSASRGRWY